MSKLETNTIDTISGTSNLTIGGANNTGTTTIKTNNTDAVTIDNSQNLKFNSGYGSVATAYGCRAWVNFNGVGTVAINGSQNVSSITDTSTGIYTVNFATNMPDANYSCVAAPGYATSTALNHNASVHAPAVGSYIIRTRNVNTNGQSDLSLITSAVFR